MWFTADIVALKDDPAWVGKVERSWEDLENQRWIPGTLFHKSVPISVRNEFTKSGKPSQGYVVVSFNRRLRLSCLIHESHLILLDRSFSFGDVVKRRAGDSMSGTVIRTDVECTLQSPIPSEQTVDRGQDDKGPKTCFRFPSPAGAVDANRFSDREHIYRVPVEELKRAETYTEETFIVYKDWVGLIKEVTEEVTLRLSNGSIVQVEDPLELEIPIDPAEVRKYLSERTTNESSGVGGRPNRRSKVKSDSSTTADSNERLKSVSLLRPAPGQFVRSSPESIRRGTWKKGAYDEDIEPYGYVVEAVITGLRIHWLYQNILSPRGPVSQPAPPGYFESHELKQAKFHVYERERKPKQNTNPNGIISGYSWGTDLESGDPVRFRDLAKASRKYNGQNNHGKLTVIPSSESEGYDVNTFQVVSTHSKVTVQWQDLSVTTQDSTELIPYLNVDELEIWPGEYVAVKVPTASAEDLIKDPDRRKPPTGSNYTQEEWDKLRKKSIGVAQSVDAGERIARVRWFHSTSDFPAGSEETRQVTVVPGAYLAKEEECSLYELRRVPRLSMRRGDFVSIESGLATGIPKKKAKAAIDWFGEIVDLRLDGLVTIRLGALEKVQDVNIAAQRVLVVWGSDDDHFEDSEDEYDSENSDWMDLDERDSTDGTHTPDVIEEVVEYEGGERLDADGGEDAWSTADEENSEITENEHNEASESSVGGEEKAGTEEELGEKAPRLPENGLIRADEPGLENKETAAIEEMSKSYREAPHNMSKFSVLEGKPPEDHAYFDDPQSMSPALTKRIWKEYKILETSLPDWVFVRTWETRIDLLRTLIIGPQHTPYALAPFVIDLRFPPTFPAEPPRASFHSWTGGVGKINPNLYEDGMICLSILGTWPGNGNVEGWSPNRSSLLQILVSILGLVLVKEPYYNEAGYEALVGSDSSRTGSIQYNDRAYILSRGFVKHALQNPIGGFEEEIKTLYLPSPKPSIKTNDSANQDADEQDDNNHPNLLRRTIEHVKTVIQRSENKEAPGISDSPSSSSSSKSRTAADLLEAEGVSRVSRGALSLLRRHLGALEGILAVAETEGGGDSSTPAGH